MFPFENYSLKRNHKKFTADTVRNLRVKPLVNITNFIYD